MSADMHPVDEAPKDGSQVIFWRVAPDQAGPVIARFCDERRAWVHGPRGGEQPMDFTPTHWQSAHPPLDTALL